MSKEIANRPGQLLAPSLDYILVDGSGSMIWKWDSTIAALDGFMDVMRSNNIASHGIVHVFDTERVESIQRDSEIGTWASFKADPLTSNWGGTPLYDAINLMGRTLRDLDPPKASIVIVTDGQANGRQVTTAVQAKAILDWCRAKGWQVTFLGADFNNADQAKALGANERTMIGVRKEKIAEAGKLLGEKRVKYAHGADDIGFSDDEKIKFGGYLGHG